MDIRTEKEKTDDDLYRSTYVLTRYWERKSAPSFILVRKPSAVMKTVLSGNLYFPRGRDMMRMEEGWRRNLPEIVFDDEGYLVSQGNMKDLPYGWFDTEHKGCGWISVYNLAKLSHHELFMQETAEALGDKALFGEAAGESIFRMYRFCRDMGLHVRFYTGFEPQIKKKMLASGCGILLYHHKYGAHYTAYQHLENDRFLFYNAVYGKRNDILSADDFFNTRVFLPACSLIAI